MGKKKFENDKEYQPIINVSLGSNETQVVWHILSEAGLLPLNTRFIKTYDDKADNHENRFKRFSIQEIPTNLVSSIGAELKIFNGTKSPSRKLVDLKLRTFLESGFSILLIGERGIGKSRVASNAKRKFDQKNPFIETNCASFTDDDKAESELFGYASGTFTGGLKEGKKGLLEEANGGILFLDEIHHLSPFVQAKLMKALQTDESNRMAVRRMGSVLEVKIECRLIFATNKKCNGITKNIITRLL
ncbi:MAG: sigma 54-interacting transcriptional regulator [Bacteroidetes bacterium]|nr:sigma 54-interacting transcriptional regulator [Bacteroidota bacterium]